MDFKNIAQKKLTFEGVELYNPVISELSEIYENEEDFFFVLKLICLPMQSEIKEQNKDITEFRFLFSLLVAPVNLIEGYSEDKRDGILNFLKLLFKNFEITFGNEIIIFSKENTYLMLTNDNYDQFKKVVSRMFNAEIFFGFEEQKEFNIQENDARAKAIVEKIKKGRQKAQESLFTETKKGLIENYISILSTGFKIPPSDICEKFTFYNLIACYNRFLSQEAWDLEIKARLAGAEARDDSPENWIKFN